MSAGIACRRLSSPYIHPYYLRERKQKQEMRINVGSAQITAKDVTIAGVPPFMEVRLSGTELIVSNSPQGKLWVRSATGAIVVTEAAMNSAISATVIERIRDLDLK